MTIQAVGWVLDHSKAELADRLVLISIANHLSKDLGQAWISYQTMGEEAGVTRRQAIESVKNLVALGELSVERGAGPTGPHGGSPLNVYRLVKYLHPGDSQSERQGERKPLSRVNGRSPEPRSNHSNQRLTAEEFKNLSEEEQAKYLGAML